MTGMHFLKRNATGYKRQINHFIGNSLFLFVTGIYPWLIFIMGSYIAEKSK